MRAHPLSAYLALIACLWCLGCFGTSDESMPGPQATPPTTLHSVAASFPDDFFAPNRSYRCTFIAEAAGRRIPVVLWVEEGRRLRRETEMDAKREVLLFDGSRLVVWGHGMPQGIVMGRYPENASLADVGVSVSDMEQAARNLTCEAKDIPEDVFSPPANLTLVPADVVVFELEASIEELFSQGYALNQSHEDVSAALCEVCRYLPAGSERTACLRDCRIG